MIAPGPSIDSNGHEPDSFDLRSPWRKLRNATMRHKMLVFLTTFFTVAIVTAYIFVWPPTYEADVLIMAESDQDQARDTFYGEWNIFRKDDVKSEVELISAGPVLEEVIQKLNLKYDDVYHPFLRHVAHLWSQSAVGKEYRRIKEKFFPRPKAAWDATPEQIELGKTVIDMKDGIKVIPLNESNVGKLVVRAPSARAAEIANTLIDTYLRQRLERHKREAQQAYDTLSTGVEQYEKDLRDIERRRREFYERNGLVFDFEHEKLEVSKWTDLRYKITSSRAEVAGLEKSLAEVRSQIAAETPEKLASRVTQLNDLKKTLQMKRQDYQTAEIERLHRYRPDSPEVEEVRGTIASLGKMIEGADEMVTYSEQMVINGIRESLLMKQNGLTSDLVGAKAGLQVLEKADTDYETRLKVMPALLAEGSSLLREHELVQARYIKLAEKKVQAGVSLQTAPMAAPSMRLVDYATPPDRPKWPNTKILIPVAIVVGFGLGIGFALLRDLSQNRVRRDQFKAGSGRESIYATLVLGDRTRRLVTTDEER